MVDWSEYKSPVQLITNQMQTKLEGQILEAIQNVGVVVDKEELIKAMNYDRDQYASGFENGYNKAIDDYKQNIETLEKAYKDRNYAAYEQILFFAKEIDEQLKGAKRNEEQCLAKILREKRLQNED